MCVLCEMWCGVVWCGVVWRGGEGKMKNEKGKKNYRDGEDFRVDKSEFDKSSQAEGFGWCGVSSAVVERKILIEKRAAAAAAGGSEAEGDKK